MLGDPVNIEIRADSVLSMPDAHDGLLHGIWVSEHEARLFISDAAHHRYTLVIDGLVHLKVSEMLEQNIVFEIQLMPSDRVKLEDAMRLYDGDDALDRQRGERLFERVRKEKLSLLWVNADLWRGGVGCRIEYSDIGRSCLAEAPAKLIKSGQ